MKPLSIAAPCLLLLLAPTSSPAAIVATSGSVVEIAPPESVVLGRLGSDVASFIFQENTGFALTFDVWVDVTLPGVVKTPADLSLGVLPTGTLVDSYLLTTDPWHSPLREGAVPYSGTVTFDRPILGLIVSRQGLISTDELLGADATSYWPASEYRGLELSFGDRAASVADSVVLSADRRTISFDFLNGGLHDQMRIVTAHIPEPTSSSLMILAAADVFCRRIFGWISR